MFFQFQNEATRLNRLARKKYIINGISLLSSDQVESCLHFGKISYQTLVMLTKVLTLS